MTAPDRITHSRFAQRILRRYSSELSYLDPGVPGKTEIQQAYAVLREQGMDVSTALRIVRQLVVFRLLESDLCHKASLEQVTNSMTALAEFALELACDFASQSLQATHGAPTTPFGEASQMWVLGMGKLGAYELNVSSDIDLIYVYDHDGETSGDAQGTNKLSNHEYFAKAVRSIFNLIAENTEHGFVFRVDLALRPNGNSGPPACSLDSLEQYFGIQAREWERFAWLKSRVVATFGLRTSGSAYALRDIVLPFVFRRYLDYNVFNSLRVLHRQIREHATLRSAGHPERTNDVKLSRGGIREVEFIVQLLQVVRGGQFPEIRTRSTLEALSRLSRAGLIPNETAGNIAKAYIFLRQVEHRIQFLDDQQTHVLPTSENDLFWLSKSFDISSSSDFLKELDFHRELVAQEFDLLLGNSSQQSSGSTTTCNALTFTNVLDNLSSNFKERINTFRLHPKVLALREDSLQHLLNLLQRTGKWIEDESATSDSSIRFVDWLESLLRRESYLALLAERPRIHEVLIKLLGSSRWIIKYLMTHPSVIDELANPDIFDREFEPASYLTNLDARLAALTSSGEDGEENLLNILRRANHSEVFRILVRDVSGLIDVEKVADDLSALAEATLSCAAKWIWDRTQHKYRHDHCFAIVAYGKFGGKELGYGSDLDIIFLYQDDDERGQEAYAIFARKLISWLTVKTREGYLYEVDTALRPNGGAGLLVSTFSAYEEYQIQRGNNSAWTWEHQAITRARFCFGADQFRTRFDAIRQSVMQAQRDPELLREEILEMRTRLHQFHNVRNGFFDIKSSPGGMIDAEFVVQFLLLSNSHHYPELVTNTGNIALLTLLEKVGLLPFGIGKNSADAYRKLRQVQHQARLNEESGQVPLGQLESERQDILTLWNTIFKPT